MVRKTAMALDGQAVSLSSQLDLVADGNTPPNLSASCGKCPENGRKSHFFCFWGSKWWQIPDRMSLRAAVLRWTRVQILALPFGWWMPNFYLVFIMLTH